MWLPDELALFDTTFEKILTDSANRWAENGKNTAECNGENRAYGELAFRSKLISERSEIAGKSGKFLWITVNPAKGTLLPDLLACVHRMYSKKWIQYSVHVYENTVNNHQHSHGLLYCEYELKRAIKELKNSVSKICAVDNPHCFKCVMVPEDIAKEKMLYMLGKKKTKKLGDVDLTREWRTAEKLKEIYVKGEAQFLLASSENFPIITDAPPKGSV